MKNVTKKSVCLLLAVLCALAVCACGKGKIETKTDNSAIERELVDKLKEYDKTYFAYSNLAKATAVGVEFILEGETQPSLTSDDIIEAITAVDADNGYVVLLRLTIEGQEKFFEVTSQNVGRCLGIYLVQADGSSELISMPVINSAVSGDAIISGAFTAESAQSLADGINLNKGALSDYAAELTSIAGEYNATRARITSDFLPAAISDAPPFEDVGEYIAAANKHGYQ